MTQLLISVRSVAEAQLALAAETDVIDIKEPRRGPLGAADSETVSEILAAVPIRVPVSIAGGELKEVERPVQIPEDLLRLTGRVVWSKVGLSRCDPWPAWRGAWEAWCQALPSLVSPVAVIYADRAQTQSPPAQEILRAASDNGCEGVLIDTFHKRDGGLLDHLSLGELGALAAEIAARGLWLALAGSLDLTSLAQVLPMRPRYVAVRGAVCKAGRTETLDPHKVAQWVRHVHSQRSDSTPDLTRAVE